MSNIWIGIIMITVGILSIVFATVIPDKSPSPGIPKTKGILGGIGFIILGILFLVGIATWK